MTQRRGNGLLADAYAPLVRLPSSHADRMLGALRRSGIAAYAAPLDGDTPEPVGTGADDPPTDHLYVDATERDAAENVLRSELPHLGEWPVDGGGDVAAEHADHADPSAASETDQLERTSTRGSEGENDVWADLVARFYESGSPPAGVTWPDAENLNSGERPQGESDDRSDDSAGRDIVDDDPASRVVRPARGEDGEDSGTPSEEHEEHYVPPEPPPLPRGDLLSRLSWGGLFGGPVLLLGSMMLGITLPGWLAFCAVAGFIAGFVVLVVRMSDHRPPGDGGAVV